MSKLQPGEPQQGDPHQWCRLMSAWPLGSPGCTPQLLEDDHQIKESEIILVLSLSWSLQAKDGQCLLGTCVPTVCQRFQSAPGMPAKRTALCLGAHKRFLYFLQSSLHCKAWAWGQGRRDLKPHWEKKPNPTKYNHQTHSCSSLCKLRFHTGIWTGAVLPDLAVATPCPT